MSVKVTMTQDKETKGTVVYREAGDEPKLGVIYVPKRSLVAPWPAKITVTIDWAK